MYLMLFVRAMAHGPPRAAQHGGGAPVLAHQPAQHADRRVTGAVVRAGAVCAKRARAPWDAWHIMLGRAYRCM